MIGSIENVIAVIEGNWNSNLQNNIDYNDNNDNRIIKMIMIAVKGLHNSIFMLVEMSNK